MRAASLAIAALLTVAAAPAAAQVDLVGEWGALNQVSEDQPHRAPGADLGDYTGLPINDAARLKARSWDASVLSQPERQAQPHPVQYAYRGGGGPNLRVEKVLDPYTSQLIAYTFTGYFGRADRTIWMDGRPHPSKYAEHQWNGFSTGEWVGSTLKVTTTHMKMGVIQRNGVPASPYASMTEFWTRHNDHLGVFTYSHEDGTRAYALDDDVPARVKKARRSRIMSVQKRLVRARQRARIGERVRVLVDGPSGDHDLVWQGRLESQAPDIDAVVYFTDADPSSFRPGSFVDAELVGARDYDLIARPVA